MAAGTAMSRPSRATTPNNRAHSVDLANPTSFDGELKALLWVIGANHNQFNFILLAKLAKLMEIFRAYLYILGNQRSTCIARRYE